MDIISFNEAFTANNRLEKIIANPDSSSGVITVPKVIATGETITIPEGRVAILPDVQVDGTLNIEGDVFIPTGTSISTMVSKTTMTDNSIVRANGTTGEIQGSDVYIDDNGNVGIGLTNPHSKLGVAHNYTLNTGANNNTVGSSIGIDSPGAPQPILGMRWTGARVGIGGHNYTSQIVADSTNNFALEMYTTGNSPLVFGTNSTEKVRIDSSGNLLLQSGTGALGYGTGAGGTVNQQPLGSKSAPVTLHKPCGKIITSNSALAAGGIASFYLYNNVHTSLNDILHLQLVNTVNEAYLYNVWATNNGPGFGFVIFIKNISNVSLSNTLEINFSLIKGAIA